MAVLDLSIHREGSKLSDLDFSAVSDGNCRIS